MTPEQIAALTSAELETLRTNVLAEQEKRRNAEAIPTEIERLNAQYTSTGAPAWPELTQAIEARKRRRP